MPAIGPRVTLHSYSLRYRFRHDPVFDIFAFLDLASSHSMEGVHVSTIGPGWGHLGGVEPDHLRAVRRSVQDHGLSLELDTKGTNPEHLRAMLDVARRCGATSLRTYSTFATDAPDRLAASVAHLATVAPDAERVGVILLLENHEDFTGHQLAEIVAGVDRPHVRALFDYGNSQMVGEDPLDAVEALGSLVHTVHVKDQVLTHDASGRFVVHGVPLGYGTLPLAALTELALSAPVQHFCLDNSWGYTAPIQPDVTELPRRSWFRVVPGRYEGTDDMTPGVAIAGEHRALESSMAELVRLLAGVGVAWPDRVHS